MFSNDTNRPVPAAIDGRRWTVNESQNGGGATDTRKADMFAPLASTPTARMIRNHELIHARITPRTDAGTASKKHGVTAQALQWAEDYRVGVLQRKLRLIDDSAITPEEATAHVKGVIHNRRALAGSLMACLPLPFQFERLYSAARALGVTAEDLEEIIGDVRACIDLAYPRLRRGRRAAPASKFKPLGFTKHTVPLAQFFDAKFPENPPPGGETEEIRAANKRVQRVRAIGKWGVIARIITPPLVRSIRPRHPIGRRFSDCGVIPSAVHRLPVDGAIFSTRRRAKGGTILCDASGSMGYSDADIERIVSNAPAATIAFYAGNSRGGVPQGNIVIGAAKGRAASIDAIREALEGGSNIIDGPALRWLAKQPGPRVWVSDEEVGGVADFGRGGPCHSECRAICAAGQIRVAHDIDEVR